MSNIIYDLLLSEVADLKSYCDPVTKDSGQKNYELYYFDLLTAQLILAKESVILFDVKRFLISELERYKMPSLGNHIPEAPPKAESEYIASILEILLNFYERWESINGL